MGEPSSDAARPTKFGSVLPYVFVSDLKAAIRYYTETLGLTLTFETEWEAEGVKDGLANVSRDGTELQLTHCRCPDLRHQGRAFFQLEVEGIDALYAEYTAKGVEMHCELALQDWGSKEFAIQDPDGNRIQFCEFQ